MIETLLPVLPVLLLFILGYVLKRISFFTPTSLGDVKKLVSKVTLPALVFNAFFTIEIEPRYLVLVLSVFLICLAMVLIGRLVAKPLKITSGYFPLLLGGFEMGMFGYALFLSLYGQQHLGKMALADLGQVIFVFFVLMTLLLAQKGEATHFKALAKGFITNPVIIAILVGLVGSGIKPYVSSNPLFETLGHLITMVGAITTPLIAITIGYGMEIKTEGLALTLKTIVVRRVFSLIFLLLLNEFIVTRLLGMDPMYRKAMMIMFLTPAPFVIALFMGQHNKDDLDYVSNMLSLDTLVSLFAIIVAAAFFG